MEHATMPRTVRVFIISSGAELQTVLLLFLASRGQNGILMAAVQLNVRPNQQSLRRDASARAGAAFVLPCCQDGSTHPWD